jgi:hydrogenase expression/formation protein HypC
MCLAIPMRVIEIIDDPTGLFGAQSALVDADGISREVRLDLVDRPPKPGDYLIVHAGFAVNTLSEEDALYNLELMREMAEGVQDNRGSGA